MSTQGKERGSASELTQLLAGTPFEGLIRYRLTFGESRLEFDAPEAKDNKELGKILSDLACGLLEEGQRVVGECNLCGVFITENEQHICGS